MKSSIQIPLASILLSTILCAPPATGQEGPRPTGDAGAGVLTEAAPPREPSPYAGAYLFAAVDLRGERRSAGVGSIRVGDDGVFKGYLRNHESGAVARLSGKVLESGKLEFVPGFDGVRHSLRILRRDDCVYGLVGRYLIRRPTPSPAADPARDDVAPEPSDGLAQVVRSAGIVIGFGR